MRPSPLLTLLPILGAVLLLTSTTCQASRPRRQEVNRNHVVTPPNFRSNRNKFVTNGNQLLSRSGGVASYSAAKRREAPAQDRIIFPGDVTSTTSRPPTRGNPKMAVTSMANEIPLDLFKKISFVNTSDFLTNFVQGFRRRLTLAPLEPPKASGVVADTFAKNTGHSGASGEHEVSVRGRTSNDVPFAEPAVCTPQPTTVSIELTKEPYVLYFPSCTRMDRCGGCCSHELLECAPTKKENVTLQVLKTRYLGPGINKFDVAEPVFVNIERHLECECQCRTKPYDCRPYQVYRPNECRCECLNEDEATSCTGEKFWNSRTCTCGCREDLECSTGLFFNTNTCMCEQSRVSRTGRQPPKFRDFSEE